MCRGFFRFHIEGGAGKEHGIQVARNAPINSHLFFADDSIIFARASKSEAAEIQTIIKCYEAASATGRNIARKLRVKSVVHHDRYLGLPTFVGSSKREIFNILLERVWKKLKGLKEKLLSKAAKEVLLKAVIQAISTYTMGVFRLPQKICQKIQSFMSNFWWKSGGEGKGLH
ncbi:uncharacterized protein LOC126686613 [Mercurialis annua]|uniref:uncharacterized protein LOC126686613 n=1 Tax=Mercurialis annua TaxID=3986 RepID=UPI00215EBCAA|nr:uncharacterized protein LOC126686613 [Mercurialis annua]